MEDITSNLGDANTTENLDLVIEDGLVNFKSYEHLNEIIGKHSGKSDKFFDAWESKNGFTSYRSLVSIAEDEA